ncbi:MAG: DEAD/DEAH box helicase [Lysobacteraceae bacterium]|nr:MAG: DEAD/DEAH box helicase [Xanthomonadaceae bacterium]
MPLETFHPAVAEWFSRTFDAPTPAQAQAWPAIAAGRHTLIAAPTGSGKTLAAFLAAIDELVRRGIDQGLPDETAVVYVSPLKALSNDVRINLEQPLAGIRDVLSERGLRDVEIRTSVRTGDTPQAERDRMRKRPPHVIVTTPESLYILLGSASGRAMLSTTRSVIVDEIHALAPNKRGAHLALSLQRLDALCERPPVRIGLSATQKPIAEVARFLTGVAPGPDGELAPPPCTIVDAGHARPRDLGIELPESPLEAVMSNEAWGQVHARIERLARGHRTTLVFVNTRRMAERLARHLSERLGKDQVTAHHGSMSKEHRHDAEQRLKRGELSVLVATASLELGIDIGDVDLVCQIGTPRAISTFLQRVGRSGHAVGATPKGRLFPLSRDELVECAALLDAVRRGELDALHVEMAPLDVLAQQVVAEVASRDWDEAELHALFRRAWPFAGIDAARFATVVRMLAEGFTTRRGPRGAYLHRDAVNGVLRASRGARLTAITSGGAIPDTADYEVVLEPQATLIGSVHEDFAVESLAGDIFQLGNHSYRILRVERGRVRVEDAQGAPPSIPFWLGEAPGRSDELSQSLSRLREEVSRRLDASDALAWLVDEVGLDEASARQIVDYLGAAKIALGLLPTQDTLAMERFFDESGGTQLVIHSPFGSRLNRAWGLALRKRFCRSFNFELQAAATEDAIVLSLSTSHSFPLEDVARYLHSSSVRDVLVQALLDAPMFGLRWRWNATTALALPRFQGGSKVPPQIQRMKSEDLLATVFPDQVACLENIVGEREIPDHPLVEQTLHDCLNEAMDIDALEALLRRVESGDARIVARDLTAPSPLAAEVLGARPYAFLDDAPLEERRTQAVASRRWGGPESAEDLGRLDPDAIAAVREEAWPEARSAEELHAALMGAGYFGEREARATHGWAEWFERLAGDRRVCRLGTPGEAIWVPAERLPQFDAILPGATRMPAIVAPAEYAAVEWAADAALVEILRARMTAVGPVRASALAASLSVAQGDVGVALLALERDGFVMRGRFSADALSADSEVEWCERHLLARIHRYTVKRLRREIEPVEPRDYMRFLFDWQRVAPTARVSGPDALASVLAQLEGFEAPASAWESSILPARIEGYEIAWLDALCQSGRVLWSRLRERRGGGERATAPVRATPIVLLQRRNLDTWLQLAGTAGEGATLSSRAQVVAGHLASHGASFFDELLAGTRLLHVQLEEALGELVAAGLVGSDSFAGLRALLVPPSKRGSTSRRHGRRRSLFGIEDAGRWSLARRGEQAVPERVRTRQQTDPVVLEQIVQVLLRRYGIVCWRLLAHEAEWLPPWRELLRTCQRLEARGEIRGGRFIAGVSGEQFALPEAIALLRSVRQRAVDGSLVCVCGADPLNLVGGLLAGDRVPRLAGARVLYRDGVPVAKRIGGEIVLIGADDPALHAIARAHLTRDGVRAPARPATATGEEE